MACARTGRCRLGQAASQPAGTPVGRPPVSWIRRSSPDISTRQDGSLLRPAQGVARRPGHAHPRLLPRSVQITGTADEWESWTGITFPESGDYVVPDGSTTVHIERSQDRGSYWEPNASGWSIPIYIPEPTRDRPDRQWGRPDPRRSAAFEPCAVRRCVRPSQPLGRTPSMVVGLVSIGVAAALGARGTREHRVRPPRPTAAPASMNEAGAGLVCCVIFGRLTRR